MLQCRSLGRSVGVGLDSITRYQAALIGDHRSVVERLVRGISVRAMIRSTGVLT